MKCPDCGTTAVFSNKKVCNRVIRQCCNLECGAEFIHHTGVSIIVGYDKQFVSNNFNICPKCQSEMEVDEEHYATDLSYWNGLIAEKDLLYWCENCQQAYVEGKKL